MLKRFTSKRVFAVAVAAVMVLTSALVAIPLLAQQEYQPTGYVDVVAPAPAAPGDAPWEPGDRNPPALTTAGFFILNASAYDPNNFRAMRMLPDLVLARQNRDTTMRLSLSVNQVNAWQYNETPAFSYAHGGGQPAMHRRSTAGAAGSTPGFITIEASRSVMRRHVHTGIDNTVPKILQTLNLHNNNAAIRDQHLRAFGVSTANLPATNTNAIAIGSANDMPTIQAAPTVTGTVPIVDNIVHSAWTGMVITSVTAAGNAAARSAAPAVISFHDGSASNFAGIWRDRNIFSGVFTNTPEQAENNEVTHWNGRYQAGNPFSNSTVRGTQTANNSWGEHNTMTAEAISSGAGFVPNAYVHSQGEDITRSLYSAVMTEFPTLSDLNGVQIALSGHITSTHQWYMSFPYMWNWTNTDVPNSHRGNNRLRGRLLWHILVDTEFVEHEASVVSTTPVYNAMRGLVDANAASLQGQSAAQLAASLNCQELRAHLANFVALESALPDATTAERNAAVTRFVGGGLNWNNTRVALEAAIALNTSAHAGGTTAVNVVAPTCTASGTHDLRCNGCEAILETGVETAATGHSWGEWTVITPADCFTAGMRTRTCTVCSDVDSDVISMREHDASGNPNDCTVAHICAHADCTNVIRPAGTHNWGEVTVTTPATCVATGVGSRTCLDCAHVDNSVTIPMREHDLSNNPNDCAVAHICAHPDCTHVIRPAGTHSFDGWTVVTEADCFTAGSRTRTCADCAHVDTETIAMREHDLSGDPGNCTVAHICAHANCTHEIRPAGSHDFGSWAVTTAADCFIAGSQERTCATCSYVETQTIAMREHDTSNQPNVCTDAWICAHPGCDHEIAPAGSHSFSAWQFAPAATCTTPGQMRRECATCGTVETEVVPVLTHVLGPWTVATPATCSAPGSEVRRCTLCNTVMQTRAIAQLTCVDTTGNGRCDHCDEVLDPGGGGGGGRNLNWLWILLAILFAIVLAAASAFFFVNSA